MNTKRIAVMLKYKPLFDMYRDKAGRIRWKLLVRHPHLSEEFIDLFFFKLKPYGVETWQTLTTNLYKKYENNINWHALSIIGLAYNFMHNEDFKYNNIFNYKIPIEILERHTKEIYWNGLLEWIKKVNSILIPQKITTLYSSIEMDKIFQMSINAKKIDIKFKFI